MDTKKDYKGKILIIDDMPDNLMLLLELLSGEGFRVLVAQSGQQGIDMAKYAHPDLILLDIMMPEINGFEACRILKADDKTSNIPIIFMTALTEVKSKIQGFELGAADYITKPIQYEEMLARISTHMKLKKATDLLEQRSLELEQRNKDLDTFAQTLTHDLKNPLNTIMGNTELLLETCDQQHDESIKDVERLGAIQQASEQMNSIIDAVLLLAGIPNYSPDIAVVDMSEIINKLMNGRLDALIKQYQGSIELPNDFPLAKGYAPWIEEVWVNYITNALKYGGHPPILLLGADIVEESMANKMIRFWVKDNGEGLSTEEQSHLFTPFSRGDKQNSREGHGLGLSIVKQIIEKLGGTVGVITQKHQGSTFYFTLPTSEENMGEKINNKLFN